MGSHFLKSLLNLHRNIILFLFNNKFFIALDCFNPFIYKIPI